MFLTPDEVTINSGDSITIQVFLENVAPTLLRAYQAEFPQFAPGGVVGTLEHDASGPSPVVDLENSDYVFAGEVAIPAVDEGPPPRLGSAIVFASNSVPVTDPKYLGELVYTASVDAGSVFTLEPQNIPLGTFLRNSESPPGDIPFTAVGSVITVIQCVMDGDCNDGKADTANTCEDGICVSTLLHDTETECCNPANGNTTLIDDGNDCTNDTCDVKEGVVMHPPLATDTPCGDPNSSECDGTFCDDENACADDACMSAVCESVDTTPEGECCDSVTGELTTIRRRGTIT